MGQEHPVRWSRVPERSRTMESRDFHLVGTQSLDRLVDAWTCR